MEDSNDSELPGWDLRTDINQQSLYNLLECVMEIAQALQGLASTPLAQTDMKFYVKPPQIASAARRTSVQIRKLMLDGNGSLLKRCVTDPNIHDLVLFYDYPPVDFVQNHEELDIVLGFEDGTSTSVSRPAFSHTTTVHPVIGLRHMAGTKFGLYNPFNYDTDPIKFQKWMNTQVVEIDGHKFKAEQLLRIMSNKEGAHTEDNPALIAPHGLSVDVDKNHFHRLFNGIRFGSLTYLQIFTLFTGLYIVNRMKMMLEHLPFPKNNESVDYICETISNSPRQITSEDLEISFAFYHMLVLGTGRELRGDYSRGTRFYIKTP
ncbi:MAG: hypothetical protein OXG26_13790 [Caldilineaceae bacterium]|nr:hypothetical protein [Caldilineaceae bacterium]